MITPQQFMEYWVKNGIAVQDAPIVYLDGNELIAYTESCYKKGEAHESGESSTRT